MKKVEIRKKLKKQIEFYLIKFGEKFSYHFNHLLEKNFFNQIKISSLKKIFNQFNQLPLIVF